MWLWQHNINSPKKTTYYHGHSFCNSDVFALFHWTSSSKKYRPLNCFFHMQLSLFWKHFLELFAGSALEISRSRLNWKWWSHSLGQKKSGAESTRHLHSLSPPSTQSKVAKAVKVPVNFITGGEMTSPAYYSEMMRSRVHKAPSQPFTAFDAVKGGKGCEGAREFHDISCIFWNDTEQMDQWWH